MFKGFINTVRAAFGKSAKGLSPEQFAESVQKLDGRYRADVLAFVAQSYDVFVPLHGYKEFTLDQKVDMAAQSLNVAVIWQAPVDGQAPAQYMEMNGAQVMRDAIMSSIMMLQPFDADAVVELVPTAVYGPVRWTPLHDHVMGMPTKADRQALREAAKLLPPLPPEFKQ